MMAVGLDWEALIQDAQSVLHPEGPKNLLAVLSSGSNLFAGEDDEHIAEFWDAQRLDFDAIYHYRDSGQPLAECDRAVWVDRLAWLLKELEACKSERLDLTKTMAILRVSRAFSFDRPIWERLPAAYFSDSLFGCIAGLVGATRCEFSSRGRREPVWEREAVDNFTRADQKGDWPAVEDLWQTVASAFWPDEDLAEAVACLCSARKGEQALAIAIDQFNSILPIMNVATVMNARQIGEVASHLKSDRGRFALIRSLTFNHPRKEALPRETLERLARLFQDVQQNVLEWQKWMKALNQYPVRTKVLQSAFGISLANSIIHAKSAYIEAIRLSTSRSECRVAVADCMATFSQLACLEERKQFWGLAQARWAKWNFGKQEPKGPLNWIAVSELDYAVIGYAMENLTAPEREDATMKAYKEIVDVANAWHLDIIEHNSAWYRALSKWQILQYAWQVVEGGVHWELPTRVYLPFDPDINRYAAMTYPTMLPSGSRR